MRRFTHRQLVTRSDCDPQAIVNYPNYFRWFDQNNERLFRDAGYRLTDMFEEFGSDGIPLIEARARFFAPVRTDDALEIDSTVESWGDKTFSVAHRISRDGEVVVEGTELRCWVVRDAGSPTGIAAAPLPEAFKRRFED